MGERRSRDVLICLALIAGTVCAYAPVFLNDFVELDDNVYITQNPLTSLGLSATGWRYAWTTFDSGNWIPLTWLSYQAEVSLFGVHAAASHGVNLALHALNTVLLYLVLRIPTGAIGRSVLVAALFGLHPLHVESVAWAAERKDVLSTFWLLVMLLTYEWYATIPHLRRLVLVAAALVLGLLSKPMLVTAPILLLLLDYWPLFRLFPATANNVSSSKAAPGVTRLLLEKGPLCLLSLGAGLMTLVAQERFSSLTPLSQLSVGLRLGNAVRATGWYLSKTFWPAGLSPLYAHPLEELSWIQVTVSAAVLLAISAYVIRFGRQRRWLVFGWGWYLIALLPVVGIVQVGVQAQADRYSYVPHIGLLTMLVWEGAWLLRRVPRLPVLAAIPVLACLILTPLQVRHWKSTISVWERVLEIEPDNWFAHFQLGSLELERGKLGAADRHFRALAQQRPDSYAAPLAQGWLAREKGEIQQAIDLFARAARINPGRAETWFDLAQAQIRLGANADAVASLQQCVALRPRDAELRNELGIALIRLQRPEKALEQFLIATQLNSQAAAGYLNAGLACLELMRYSEARSLLLTARRLQPSDPSAAYFLATLESSQGDRDAAIRYLQEVLRIDPGHTRARDLLKQLTTGN